MAPVESGGGAGRGVLSKAVDLIRPTVNTDEERVLDELLKAGGELLQRDLPRKTGYSKATVSKIVQGLERRSIISREKFKWTYWVRISDRLKSEAEKD